VQGSAKAPPAGTAEPGHLTTFRAFWAPKKSLWRKQFTCSSCSQNNYNKRPIIQH